MIKRFQYRCSFKDLGLAEELVEPCKERAQRLIEEGKLCNVSFYRYENNHTAIVEEGLWKGDKYAFISMHENLLFSYYEEPRNNVNILDREEDSKAITEWMAVDPESHFDRVKAKGDNFLVIPCLFSVDRVDAACW